MAVALAKTFRGPPAGAAFRNSPEMPGIKNASIFYSLARARTRTRDLIRNASCKSQIHSSSLVFLLIRLLSETMRMKKISIL